MLKRVEMHGAYCVYILHIIYCDTTYYNIPVVVLSLLLLLLLHHDDGGDDDAAAECDRRKIPVAETVCRPPGVDDRRCG